MTASPNLGIVAAWFVAGMARIVFTSKLAEHRIDKPDPVSALAANRKSSAARHDLSNYDRDGQRLLPWYRAVNITYWLIAAGTCWWGAYSVYGSI